MGLHACYFKDLGAFSTDQRRASATAGNLEPGRLVSAIGLLIPQCRPGRTTKTPRLQGNLSRRSRSYGHSMGVNTPARKSALVPAQFAQLGVLLLALLPPDETWHVRNDVQSRVWSAQPGVAAFCGPVRPPRWDWSGRPAIRPRDRPVGVLGVLGAWGVPPVRVTCGGVS